MKQSVRLGSVAGIPVGLHWGLVVIALLYLTNLATGFLPAAAPGSSGIAYWLAAGAGVVLFFGSILAHEIGHSLVAQREGIRVRAITLWLLGGVAEIEEEAKSPGAEFRIAAAGPAVSIALAAAFFGLGVGLESVFGPSLAATTLRWLGLLNGLLAVFNLIPAAPLDGGRILAAALWYRSGDAHLARARAAMAGQAFGLVMVGLAGWALFNGGGVLLLLLAWFLYVGATAERRRAELFSVAAHASVGEVMTPLAAPTDSAVTASGLIAMSGDRSVAFPVRGPSGTIVGIVPPVVLHQVHPRRRDHVRAGDIAVPWSQFIGAHSHEKLSAVVDRFKEQRDFHALVYDDWGQHAGYVGLAELAGASRFTTV